MAIGNEQVTVATCDACGKRTYGDPGNVPAVITGEVTDNTRDPIVGIEWSACSHGHIGGAVKNAIQEARYARQEALHGRKRPAAPAPVSSVPGGIPRIGGDDKPAQPASSVGQ